MLRTVLRMIVQGLLPVVPCLWVARGMAEGAVIAPWPAVVLFILCVNLFLVVFGWKRLGDTPSDRYSEALLMLAAVFEPLLTHHLLLAESSGISVAGQIFLYGSGQAAIWITLELAPDLYGRWGERRYCEKVLSGKIQFKSRKEFLEERERRAEKKKGKRGA